jgi:hypothetical protein
MCKNGLSCDLRENSKQHLTAISNPFLAWFSGPPAVLSEAFSAACSFSCRIGMCAHANARMTMYVDLPLYLSTYLSIYLWLYMFYVYIDLVLMCALQLGIYNICTLLSIWMQNREDTETYRTGAGPVSLWPSKPQSHQSRTWRQAAHLLRRSNVWHVLRIWLGWLKDVEGDILMGNHSFAPPSCAEFIHGCLLQKLPSIAFLHWDQIRKLQRIMWRLTNAHIFGWGYSSSWRLGEHVSTIQLTTKQGTSRENTISPYHLHSWTAALLMVS